MIFQELPNDLAAVIESAMKALDKLDSRVITVAHDERPQLYSVRPEILDFENEVMVILVLWRFRVEIINHNLGWSISVLVYLAHCPDCLGLEQIEVEYIAPHPPRLVIFLPYPLPPISGRLLNLIPPAEIWSSVFVPASTHYLSISHTV
jgi:hypothetical protein